MQQQLINRNPDLKKIQDNGYDIEVIGGQYLLVHHIPYLNSVGEIKYGTLVCILTLSGPTQVSPPRDHTIYFIGDTPCDINMKPLNSIINNSNQKQLTENIIAQHYFSSKPLSGNYPNYYEKIRTYTEILGSQARAKDSMVTYKKSKKNDEQYF